jgi:hypothetical protein
LTDKELHRMTWKEFVAEVDRRIDAESAVGDKPIDILWIDLTTDLGTEFRIDVHRDRRSGRHYMTIVST